MQKGKKKKIIIALSCAALIAALIVIYFPRRIFHKPVSALLESSDGKLLGARIASDGQWRFPQIDTVPDKFARASLHMKINGSNTTWGWTLSPSDGPLC